MTSVPSDNPFKAYQEFLGGAIAAPWVPELLAHAAPRAGERVLDLACGTGIVARQVAPIVGTAGKVVALDCNPSMLAVAQELEPPAGAAIRWCRGDAVRLDLPSGMFDLVLCQQGLQFFSDRVAALKEIGRVLAGTGRVVLSVWQALQAHPVYEVLLEATARHLGTPVSGVASAFSLCDAAKLRSLLESSGFTRIAITSTSLESEFPSAERFLGMTLLGAAAVVPAFSRLDAQARSELAAAVERDVGAVVQRYRIGEKLKFPMSAHIAVGHASAF